MKIVIIEDDETISFAIKTFLEKENIEVVSFDNLSDSENMEFDYVDLILLDVNLADGSGFDFLKWLREFSNIPVIMLTVKDEDKYIVKGLSEGADDYMTKPFSLAVLKARIENLIRRKSKKSDEIVFKDLSLNVLSKSATIDGVDLNLNLKEFALLEILLENKNTNVLRERIIDSVWGYDVHEVEDNTLTVTIKRLRHKLGKYSNRLKTIRGIGYMWESGSNEEV